MFDGFHTGFDRPSHALLRSSVSNKRATAGFCDLPHAGQLLNREGGHRLAIGSPTIVCVDLDEIGAVPDLLPGLTDQVIHSVRSMRAQGLSDTRMKSLGPVAASGNDGWPGHKETRTRDHALVDGCFHTDIGIAGAFRSQVPKGREAGVQCHPGMLSRPDSPLCVGFLEHLIIPVGL